MLPTVDYIPVVPENINVIPSDIPIRPSMRNTGISSIPVEEDNVEQIVPITTSHVIQNNVQLSDENRRILNAAQSFGISFRVTSGTRPGAKTNKGKTSYHATGEAIDVTPIPGQSGDDLRAQVQLSGFSEWLGNNGYRIIEEVSKADQKKYGASGANGHIGKDGM